MWESSENCFSRESRQTLLRQRDSQETVSAGKTERDERQSALSELGDQRHLGQKEPLKGVDAEKEQESASET